MPAPVLMEFYLLCKNGEISEQTYSEIITIINTYLIRRSFCNFDTSGITRLFPTFLKDVLVDCETIYYLYKSSKFYGIKYSSQYYITW